MEFVLELLNTYRVLAVFIGSALFGDTVLFAVAYLGGQESWSMAPIVAAAFLGTAISDTGWYFAGKFGFHIADRFSLAKNGRETAGNILRMLIGKNPAIALIYIKFLYGSRIAMIVYLASHGISFWRFTLFNSLGICAWLAVFFPLGYLAGMGVSQLIPSAHTLQITLSALVVGAIALRLITLWFTRRVEK